MNSAAEKVYFKRLMYLPDFRVAINIHEINRIDKIEDFSQSYCTCRYGIVINKGFQVQQKTQSQNLECWYENEDARDERFNQLLVEFEAIGIDVIKV